MSSEPETRAGVAEPVAPAPAPWGARVLGAVLLAVGLFLLWTAYRAAGGDYSASGPWLAPLVVTTGWVVLATWYLVGQFRTPHRVEPAILAESHTPPGPEAAARQNDEPDTAAARKDGSNATETRNDGSDAVDGRDDEPAAEVRALPPALVSAALLGYVLLLAPVGFVLASALFFVACARILGSRAWLRDIAVAVPLALGVYYGFTRGLDITLPAGVLPL
ncbi:tripartite tricarboxylate transporter TctB family protein [Plantactinospora endophytica]|uniref:DUF1468 domain-containing protein n=1 Tax=Plantactinospora endophytica TaxID=673535 RepID=A0ABQ4E8Z2_9ACTN|nr:tripartite tricarboxylate transporter TctB family protein [Plantactinospora endophytica]GIG91169.1 hypothetical protein Pen02_61050 [Plantactinospora endophytica]